MPTTITTTLGYMTARSIQTPDGESARVSRIAISGGDRYVATFDNSGSQLGIWTITEFPSTYTGGVLTLDVDCYCAGTSGNITLAAYVEAITPGDAIDLSTTNSFDSANTATVAVSASANNLFTVSITLTNKDSVAVNDLVRIKLVRTTDTYTGVLNVLGATLNTVITDYLMVDGSNASSDLNIAAYNITTTGTVNSGNEIVGTNTTGGNITAYSTLGPELAPALTAANWTVSVPGSWTFGTSPNVIIHGTGAYAYASCSVNTFSPVIGTVYKITMTFDYVTGTTLYVYMGVGDGSYGKKITAPGTYTWYMTAVNATTKFGIVDYNSPSTSTCQISAISIKAVTTGGDANVEGTLYVGKSIRRLNSSSDTITIKDDGKIGINSPNPIATLDVTGGIKFSTLSGYNGANQVFLADMGQSYGTRVTVASGYIFGWGTTATQCTTIDTGLTRAAAGTVAIGNGTASSATGTLNLTNIVASGDVKGATFHAGSSAGVSGTFTTADSKTVTVTNGIITSIV